MKLFDNKGNYSEYKLKPSSTKSKDFSDIDSIDKLPNGTYKARFYGCTLELEDGTKYRTNGGVRNRRESAQLQDYKVEDGKVMTLAQNKFSGMGEVGAGLMGATYGKGPADTRITLDTKGFKLPKDTVAVFKIKDKQKSFSMDPRKRGVFTGRTGTPSITITKDNSIIREDKSKGQGNATGTSQSNAMTNTSLEWNKERAFHLAVEPWITAPLQSDVEDGIYVGSIKGNKIDTGKLIISLLISISVDYPESVIVLIKNQKAFIFKQSALTASTGSRIFSEVTSDEQFRKYAHNLMRSAHKDNYSEDTTNKVVDDLLKNHEGKEYGELIGRLKSGLGNKNYSEIKSDDEFIKYAHTVMKEAHKDNYDPELTDKVANELLENNKTKDYGELIGRLKSGLGNKSYSQPTSEVSYKFDYTPSEPKFEMQAVIGTLIMSAAFSHLFHLCTTDYATHLAMKEYYEKIPSLVDDLAENYLANTKAVNFQVCIVPQTMCPVAYMERLQEYLIKYQNEKLATEPTFSGMIDGILILISSTLYKLRRLSSGRKIFSFIEQKEFSTDRPIYLSSGNAREIKDTITDLIGVYFKKFKRSPVKDIKTKDGRTIKKYVDNKVIDDKSLVELLKSLAEGIAEGTSNVAKAGAVKWRK